jgi:hypothetical protein
MDGYAPGELPLSMSDEATVKSALPSVATHSSPAVP